jgi:hypothetical protein
MLKFDFGKAHITPVGAGHDNLPGAHLFHKPWHKLVSLTLTFKGGIALELTGGRYALPGYDLVAPLLLIKEKMYFACCIHGAIRQEVVVVILKLVFVYHITPLYLTCFIHTKYHYFIIKITGTLAVVKTVKGPVKGAVGRVVKVIIVRIKIG